MENVDIALDSRSYSIYIEAGLLSRAGEMIASKIASKKAAILSSAEVAQYYAEPLLQSLHSQNISSHLITMSDGELSKSWSEVGRVLSELAKLNLDRHSFIIAWGGGAIGDAAGLIASLYMRGIPLVQIPTTLLAMVDSSVGGKTGINLPEGKNLVGTFHQPSLVLIDPNVLKTLPLRQLYASTAEIIKYGIIRDAALFETLKKGMPEDWTPIIKRCCEIKARIVEEDEFETQDVRALLNFGHTLGHAIEAQAGFGGLLHGEAISLGMVGATYLSVKHADLLSEEANRITQLLAQYQLPIRQPDLNVAETMELLQRDKKFKEGKIRFVLTSGLGSAFVSDQVTLPDCQRALEICRGD
ncbi:MAG: 3-dehydroquinate synthase [Verrucomicrobiae bacterium]|nr:3-dehydroquinate synthase [Verrucomicrobiae bacterium]